MPQTHGPCGILMVLGCPCEDTRRTQWGAWQRPTAPISINVLTEVGGRGSEPSPNRLTRPLAPSWRRGSRGLGRGGFFLLAATGDRQQERRLAAVGNSLGARGLARCGLLGRRLGILC